MSLTGNIISINQIVDWFEDFSQRHDQLNSYGYGETYDFGTTIQMTYPTMWVSHSDANSIGTSNKTTIPVLTFNVMIVDKINIQDNYEESNSFKSDNKREIMSDTFQIGQDLITEIQGYWDSYGLILKSDVTCIPVVDETPDKVCGWMFSIPFTLRFVNCSFPASPINI